MIKVFRLLIVAAFAALPCMASAHGELARTPQGHDMVVADSDATATQTAPDTSGADATPSRITIFPAKTIVTLDPGTPEAETVAVMDGKILGVGTLEEMQGWGNGQEVEVDRRFENAVIVPGFIEAHMHPQVTGILWQGVYVGRFDRTAPDGTKVSGLKTKDDVLARLKDAASKLTPDDAWLIAWRYQPEFYNNAPLTRADLGPITGGHPAFIENLSMHIYYANSKAFEIAGIADDTTIDGIIKENGKPTGEIEEIKAALSFIEKLPPATPEVLTKATRDAAQLAHRVGVTTFADLSFGSIPGGYKVYQTLAADPDYPLRTVLNPLIQFFSQDAVVQKGGLDYLAEMQKNDTDRLSFGGVKFIVDGSVQGYTSLIEWPHYFKTMKNGIANISQDELNKGVLEVHKRGYQAIIHTNANQATEMGLNALELAAAQHPLPATRHRLENNQLATEAQLQRLKELGGTTNLFMNHIYYWGDLHYSTFLGPDRARRMNAAGTAQKLGIPFSLHSGASVTPVNPLFSMWVATARETMSGRVLGRTNVSRLPMRSMR